MLFVDHSTKYTAQLLGWTEDYHRVCFVLSCVCHFIILIIERSLSWTITVASEYLFSMLKGKLSENTLLGGYHSHPPHPQVDIIWGKGIVRFFFPISEAVFKGFSLI